MRFLFAVIVFRIVTAFISDVVVVPAVAALVVVVVAVFVFQYW